MFRGLVRQLLLMKAAETLQRVSLLPLPDVPRESKGRLVADEMTIRVLEPVLREWKAQSQTANERLNLATAPRPPLGIVLRLPKRQQHHLEALYCWGRCDPRNTERVTAV